MTIEMYDAPDCVICEQPIHADEYDDRHTIDDRQVLMLSNDGVNVDGGVCHERCCPWCDSDAEKRDDDAYKRQARSWS